MGDKVTLDKEKSRNLMKMLTSSDQDNRLVALKAMNECNIEESLGFLLVLYKFGGLGSKRWESEAPNVWEKFESISLVDKIKGMPTATNILNKMIMISAPTEAITSFLEFHSEDLIDTLRQWGYPMELMDVQITLKEKEYAK